MCCLVSKQSMWRRAGLMLDLLKGKMRWGFWAQAGLHSMFYCTGRGGYSFIHLNLADAFLARLKTPRGLLSLAPTPVQSSAWREPGRGYTHRWRQPMLANSSKRIQDFTYLGWTARQIPSPTPPVPKPDALHCARYKESNRTGKAQNNPKQLLPPCWARSGKHLYSLVFSRLWVWLNECVCTGFIAAHTCQKLHLVWGQKSFLI